MATDQNKIIKILEEIREDQRRHFRTVEHKLANQSAEIDGVNDFAHESWQIMKILAQILLFSRGQINRAFGLSKNTLNNWKLPSYSEVGSTLVAVKLSDVSDKLIEKRKNR